MPTLNRFPLLGLWAKEAARRLGYTKGESEALGHAYAVLYAIRANTVQHKEKEEEEERAEERPARAEKKAEVLDFAGDELEVTHDAAGHLRGLVGGGRPQTPRSYRVSVEAKFPPGYYEKLEKAFHDLWHRLAPRTIKNKLVYKLYDQWKKSCANGRAVDLDKLLAWCKERTEAKR
jgi:hypothetical protein